MLPRLQVFHGLCRQLREIAPAVRITQIRGLVLLVLGVTWANSVSLPKVAAALPMSAHPASTERRMRRWLGNERIEMERLWSLIRRALLAPYAGQELILVFDPTPFQGRHSILCLGLVQGKRVLPLAWEFQPLRQAWGSTLVEVLDPLFRQVAADLPASCEVTLLADRGFVGPGLVDLCQRLGWQLVLRLRSSANDTTRIRLPDGTVTTIGALVTGPGQRWQSPVWIFKKAGWRQGWLTIHWTRRHAEPWVLLSTRPGGPDRVREYRRRFAVEATYQDLKGRGLHLDHTRVRDHERLHRLFLIATLAFWWLQLLGDFSVRQGLRRYWDRPDRHTQSRFTLGHHLLRLYESENRIPPLLLTPGRLKPLSNATSSESVRK